MTSRYVYVASSWRNERQPVIVAALLEAGIDCYDFKNPPDGAGFGWEQLADDDPNATVTPKSKGTDWVSTDTYLRMIEHPRAQEGFAADFAAMKRADTFVLVLPCGKSAHLELGWAVGAGKRTAILLEDPVEPELMYKMVDLITPSLDEILRFATVHERHDR